jgi:hypothetical protein
VPLSLGKQWIQLGGCGFEAVIEGRQTGVEHARRGGVDGHVLTVRLTPASDGRNARHSSQ